MMPLIPSLVLFGFLTAWLTDWDFGTFIAAWIVLTFVEISVATFIAMHRRQPAPEASDEADFSDEVIDMNMGGVVIGRFNDHDIFEFMTVKLSSGKLLTLPYHSYFNSPADVPESLLAKQDCSTVVLTSGICYHGEDK